MKKIGFILMICLLVSACSTIKETGISRSEKRESQKLAKQVAVKKAVESRRYIIRMERIYPQGGGFLDLVPKSNFIIVDGGAASISLGYVGRNYGIRPISGINLNGQTVNYKLQSNEEKGVYNVNMEVRNNNNKFDIYLTIGSDGSCSTSVNNSYIQTARYFGHLVPIPERVTPGKEVQPDSL
jgi:hypothetical protein